MNIKTTIALLFLGAVQFVNSQIYNNGNLSTGTTTISGTTAPAGYTWSEVSNDTGNTSEANLNAGFAASFNIANTENYKIADNFKVQSGEQWFVSSIDFFCYQTNYNGTTIPIDQLKVQIWDGDPSLSTSNIIAGNHIDNVLNVAESGDSMIYRIFNSVAPAPGYASTLIRKLWKVKASFTIPILNPGTYWITFQAHATNNAYVYFAPVTTPGARTSAAFDAKQQNVLTNSWSGMIDTGNPSTAIDVSQDIAFTIHGGVTLQNEKFNEIHAYFFPNPVSNELEVNLQNDNSINEIQIVDINGRILLSKNLVNETSIKVDFSQYSLGVYFVNLKTTNGSVQKKVIKQ